MVQRFAMLSRGIVLVLLVCCIHAFNRNRHIIVVRSQTNFRDARKLARRLPFISRTREWSFDKTLMTDKVFYVFNDSESGYVQAAETGISVSKGSSAELKFSITVDAVVAGSLSENDDPFIDSLGEGEREEYLQVKETYTQNLDIPFLSWIGANLTQNVSSTDLLYSSLEQDNYNVKAKAATQILQNATSADVSISGSRMVVGQSYIPVVAFSYIKIARITLNNGSTVIIVSNSSDDVVVATDSGNVIAAGADTFEMAEVSQTDKL